MLTLKVWFKRTKIGNIKKIDNYEPMVVLTDGVKIPIEDIVEIKAELFNFFDGLTP